MGNKERRDRGAGMNRKRLRKEVAEVQNTRKEGDQELALADSVTNPSMLFDFFARTVSVAKPTAPSLSHKMTGGGWGHPRLPSAQISPTAIWLLAKTPAYSDSDTAAVTTGMRAEWQWMPALRKRGSEVPR